ncbi:sensor histidine kinase [Saccharothrix deserti]|uniref:sensor histidine kinase n=1 Tax=Saccharothrix deserti TaxID=2593674 RepID=UPI00192E39C2|nr:sensor histidine kinase [Saccharothrix deserti]
MSGESDRWGWARRFVAAPHAPIVGGVVLGAGAVTESVVRAVTGGADTQLVLVLGLLALGTTAPVAFLRPTPAAIAVSAAGVLSLGLFHTLTVAGLGAQLIVLYRLGRAGGQVLATCLAAPYLVLALVGPGVPTVLASSLGLAAGWVGIARWARGEASVHRAARQAVAGRLIEHTARGERARIARELHDVVAHHISMIAVQAETARLTTPGMPAAGAQRLSEIGDTARAGLTEMRRLLGVLREDAPEEVADRRPQPGLQQLNELLDHARDTSGAGARLIVSGTPSGLDPGVELAAYRIVQEALTNARRHAPGAAVDVELHYTDEALRLRIRDNGPGPPATTPPGGHGLTGMRERAAAVGGRLHVGPAVVGGFLVEASLPAKAAG